MNFNTEIEQPSNTPKEEPLQVICSGILKKDGYLLGLREKWQGAFIFEGGEGANREGGRCAVFSPAIPETPKTGRNGQKTPLFVFRLILIT